MTITRGPAFVTPIMERRSDSAAARIVERDGRPIVELRIEGGKHHGAVGEAGAETMERAIRLATEIGVPFVAWLDTAGADVGEGISSLHGWGRCAHALVQASGVVPTVIIVTGACVSGPALCLGLVDHVIMTADAFAYVSGPEAVAEVTGVTLDRLALGGAAMHGRMSGVASLVVEDEDEAEHALAALLEYLPSNHLEDAPGWPSADRADRDCTEASRVVPAAPNAAYDVRTVVRDIVDADSLLELRPGHASSIVIGLAHLDSRVVGVVANQPFARAGALDIDASRKAARFVQWCDAFNLPIVTFVDTPGFEPGKDLEWRGMIRHGAQLAHAYVGSHGPPPVRRVAQGVRRRLHRHGLQAPRKRLLRGVARRADRRDGCAGGGADLAQSEARRDRRSDQPRGGAGPSHRRVRSTVQQPVRGRGTRLRGCGHRSARHPSRPGDGAQVLREQARGRPVTPALEHAALALPVTGRSRRRGLRCRSRTRRRRGR